MSRKPAAALGLAMVFGSLVTLAPAVAAPAEGGVVVNEVITNDPVLPDSIELYNTGATEVDLSGWIVKDDKDDRTDALPEGTKIAPGAYLVLQTDKDFTFGLGNGDAARIFDATGTLVDGVTFPSHSNPSWSRCPDGVGDLAQGASVTLGAANDCAAPTMDVSNLILNEVDSGPLDWVEFYNDGDTPVDISGFVLTDNAPSDTTHRYEFPAGTIIEPKSYFVVDGNSFGFGLGGADSAMLFPPGSTFAVDEALMWASWTEHAAVDGDEASYANSRCPNAVGNEFVVAKATPGAFNDCATDVRINEVESDGDSTDWVEVVNASDAPVDISGWTIMDNDPAGHAADVTPVPAGTVLAPGGYYVFDQNKDFSFGLGKADSATLRNADGAIVAEYSWTAHAAVSYGRCPDATGDFVDQTASTKGAVNNCGDAPVEPEPTNPTVTIPWPGSPDVTVVDETQMFLEDSSGLDFQETADGGILWGIDNDAATIFKMIVAKDGTLTKDAGWENGKKVRFLTDAGPNGPDAEGITVAADGTIYLAVERDNNDKGTNFNVILQVNPNATGDVITASQQWDITATLPAVAANTGIEAVEWIPDAAVTGTLWDDAKGKAYDPADYPGHIPGVFITAVEDNGNLYAFSLNADGTHSLISEIEPFLGGVMALDWDPEIGGLWAMCDNGCAGLGTLIMFNGTNEPTLLNAERPASMPDLNNEGFATSQGMCSDGMRPVWWFADGEVPAALRTGTLACISDDPTEPVPTDDPTNDPTDDPTDEPTVPVTEDPTDDDTVAPVVDKGGNNAGGMPNTGVEAGSLVALAAILGGLGVGALAIRRRAVNG